jgi:hypothetical protein
MVHQHYDFIFWPAAIAIGAASILWQNYQRRKRTQGMIAAARRLGLDFCESRATPPEERLRDFSLLREGNSRSFRNILRGEPEGTAGAILFDYEYETGSGRNRSTHRQSVAALAYAKGGLPRFELRPEDLLHKIGELFGAKNVDVAADPAFSKKYLLRGPDEPAVAALFGLNLRQYFESHPGWFVEGEGGWLVACRHGRRVAPEEVPAFLDEAKLLLWAFPR